VPNRDNRLYPGMYGHVTIEIERKAHVLAVPTSALVTGTNDTAVYVVHGNRTERVPVKTGLNNGQLVEITDGLAEGSEVIVTGRSAPAPGTLVQTSTHHG
jgi:multidrug efflux pump subunit AcrA (membrane-fusion protein)